MERALAIGRPIKTTHAQAYQSVSRTSIDNERLVSLAGHVVNDNRNKMSGDKAVVFLFVKKNLPLLSM